jgi:hypothetical protein
MSVRFTILPLEGYFGKLVNDYLPLYIYVKRKKKKRKEKGERNGNGRKKEEGGREREREENSPPSQKTAAPIAFSSVFLVFLSGCSISQVRFLFCSSSSSSRFFSFFFCLHVCFCVVFVVVLPLLFMYLG